MGSGRKEAGNKGREIKIGKSQIFKIQILNLGQITGVEAKISPQKLNFTGELTELLKNSPL